MRIFIMGAGHMGAWFAEQFCLEHEVAVYDTDSEKLTSLFQTKRLGELNEVKEFRPQLVLNAVSLRNTHRAFSELLPYLSKDCLLSDIASVKTGFYELYKRLGRRFVSTHPMFGPTFANLKELYDENAIIIKESDEHGKRLFRGFYRGLNINIREYTFEEHDKAMAYSLSIPYVSSMVFACCMKNQDAPGTTFKKHLEIAQGLLSKGDHLLSEILFNANAIPQIEEINSQMAYLAHIIRERDYEEMHKFLNRLRSNIT